MKDIESCLFSFTFSEMSDSESEAKLDEKDAEDVEEQSVHELSTTSSDQDHSKIFFTADDFKILMS